MSMSVSRGIAAGVLSLGLLLLAGCQTAGEAEPGAEPTEPQQERPRPAPEPPPTVEPTPDPRRMADPQGNPLDEAGEPLGRVFFFEFDRSDLRGRARGLLTEHAAYLRENPRIRVTIEGHADERGTREYNQALGERRADAVAGYLRAQGVNADQLRTVSYGEENPVDPGHDESAWSRNRRAEIVY